MSNGQQIIFLRRLMVVLLRVVAIVYVTLPMWQTYMQVILYFPDTAIADQGGLTLDDILYYGSYPFIAILLWTLAPLAARLAVRARDPKCPRCGYVISAPRCPECGLYLGPDFHAPPTPAEIANEPDRSE